MREIVVLHETDGRPYYPALNELAGRGGSQVVYRENSVFRNLLKALLWRSVTASLLRRCVGNFGFRFSQFCLAEKIVIVAFAPYDFRVLYFLPLLFNRKNIIIWHTSWPRWDERVPRTNWEPLRSLMEAVYRFVFRTSVDHAVGVTSLSCASLGRAMKFGQVSCIPHVVSFGNGNQGPIICAAGNLGAIPRPLKVLFVGKLIPEKGIDVVVQLAKDGPSSVDRVTVIGDGPLGNMIRALGPLPKLDFLGAISDRSRLEGIFRQHDVLVVPSVRSARWEELFGIVVIEAMAAGLVVMATDHVGPSSVIRHGKDGYLFAEEGVALSIREALRGLAGNPTLRLEMSRNAINSAERFSKVTVCRQWKELLDSLDSPSQLSHV